jgi:hypothetical protein
MPEKEKTLTLHVKLPLLFRILIKIVICWQILVKFSAIKFHIVSGSLLIRII